MKKIILCLLLAMISVFSITACGIEIADSNGADDFSLAEITDENIINMDLGASGYSQSSYNEDGNNLEELTKFKAKSFSGVAEIYSTNLILKSDLVFDISTIQVDSGNFRLMVLVDDEIVHEFDLEEMSQSYELKDTKGAVSVRMAGESDKFKFYIQVR